MTTSQIRFARTLAATWKVPSPHQHLRAQMETPTQDQYHHLRICLPRDVQGSMIRIVHRVDKPLILRLSTR